MQGEETPVITWTNETEAMGYAGSRLADAHDQLDRITDPSPTVSRDGMALALAAMTEAIAALVLVKHARAGDQLLTIDQLTADLTAAQAPTPIRRCCQTYAAERHAAGCISRGQR